MVRLRHPGPPLRRAVPAGGAVLRGLPRLPDLRDHRWVRADGHGRAGQRQPRQRLAGGRVPGHRGGGCAPLPLGRREAVLRRRPLHHRSAARRGVHRVGERSRPRPDPSRDFSQRKPTSRGRSGRPVWSLSAHLRPPSRSCGRRSLLAALPPRPTRHRCRAREVP